MCAWEDHEQNIRDGAVKSNGYLKKPNPLCCLSIKRPDNSLNATQNPPLRPLYLIHLLQLIPSHHLMLRHQNPHQALPQHILPTDPRMHLPEQPLPILHPPRPLHQLRDAAGVELHVRRQVVHLGLPHAPGVAALAPVVPAQRRRRDADELRRDVGAAEVGGCGRVGGEVRPVKGGVAGVQEDLFGGSGRGAEGGG